MSTPTLLPRADPPSYRALDALTTGASGPEVWRALGAEGLLPRAYRDGDPRRGLEPGELGRLLAAVDGRFSLGTTLAVCVPLATCLPLLARAAGPASRTLSDALRGRTVVALAATDDTAGCDLTSLNTEAVFDDDVVELNGTKRWITNATRCEALLVLARHRPGPHFTNFTWVLVPADAPGVHAEPADTDLFDGSGTGHLSFDHVRLGREHVMGGVGRGMSGFAAHIASERLAGALWAVALCRRVLRDTLHHLRERPYADGTLWHVEGIRQRYAAALLLARQHQALTAGLADAVASGRDATSAAMLKASAAGTVERVLDECAHLQGAHGFRRGGPQELRAQAALFGIGGGTTEIVLSVMAGAATDLLEELDR
ncbi:acyl-CoA dehydrogenase family protein [Streptomyces candidus]|uniref:Citronellyl-CoA dehydrogenase n=1 Tax=Streptomyces candidus TaxID=67283 RepID=A0A7X0HJE1_9ACTN|nr:acyl-CoA dehydrogenase [Streptomyces candidus]MBB6438620.1 citronellyl-CoA dehydrogenase [Streptomyces candidus]GHH45292.1 acyl-CoA dehydrogenase [Streptomyces candidus]